MPRQHDAAEKRNKKTDVAEHRSVFHHVGLLFNEPPGTPGCSLTSHPTNEMSFGSAVILDHSDAAN
jgi:hypothetical protein